MIPAFIWGFGHSTYPNQPFFIRGLEVGMAGVVMGFLMLRFGVVPLLVWHFTVDALYTALVLLRSGNTYYVVSGALASGILLLPLFASLVLYARRGGFLPAAGLTNGDRGFVPEPADVAPPAALVAGRAAALPGRPRGRGRGGAGARVVLLRVDPELRSSARRGRDGTRRGRGAGAALPASSTAWIPSPGRSVAYTGTGFAYDESVREAKPQDDSGIPGFSYDAARYVIAAGRCRRAYAGSRRARCRSPTGSCGSSSRRRRRSGRS